jgi:adenylate cyclase
MILTLQKLLQKSKQVTDPRDVHALALDLVESMLRHYAVVAIAAYRHAGARDSKINRILSEQLPRPSMGSWKNFLQMLAAVDKEQFPEHFHEKFLAPLTKRLSYPDITSAFGGVKNLVEQMSEFTSPTLSFGPVECTALDFFDKMVTYRNRFAGHGTRTIPAANMEFTPALLNGVTSLCHHLRNSWLSYPVFVAKSSHRYGLSFFRLVPLVEAERIGEAQSSDPGLGEDRLCLCLGERKHPEVVSLYPLALWEEEDILFYNGAKDFRDISYIGFVSQRSIETNMPEKDFRELMNAFTAHTKVSVEPLITPVEKPHPSIVVLPFVNISSDPEQEYFCDGITEEIINALSHIEDLKVIARTSAFYFKGKDVKIKDIGKELNVETVLEGSVRKAGNKIRITAQLINISDSYHLWSEKYDRNMEDIFDIQDEISLAIVEALKVNLLKEEKESIMKRMTHDQEAFNLYVKGKHLRIQYDLNKARKYFQMAIEKDNNYALSYVGIADTYHLEGTFGIMPPQESFPKAKKALNIAFEIDNRLAEAHASLAWIHCAFDWDWSAADSEFQHAFKLNPQYPFAHEWYAIHLAAMGKIENAILEIERAQVLDPLAPIISGLAIWFYLTDGRYNEAIEHFHKAVEINSKFGPTYMYLGETYTLINEYEMAIDAFRKAVEYMGPTSWAKGWLGYAYGLSGDAEKTKQIIRELSEHSQSRYVPPYNTVLCYIGLDDSDNAFKWLNIALEQRDMQMILLNTAIEYRTIRYDPRFKSLLKKMNFPKN